MIRIVHVPFLPFARSLVCSLAAASRHRFTFSNNDGRMIAVRSALLLPLAAMESSCLLAAG